MAVVGRCVAECAIAVDDRPRDVVHWSINQEVAPGRGEHTGRTETISVEWRDPETHETGSVRVDIRLGSAVKDWAENR